MVGVLVEVGNGARFGVVVRAENIRGAVAIAKVNYPDTDVRVVHPIESEPFVVRDTAAPACSLALEMPKSVAG